MMMNPESADPLDYSIVVPAYNEAELLPATLQRLTACMAEIPNFRGELIVVDNASTDATAAIATDQGATVVVEPHRQIARARNAGAAKASGRWLIFVDADTLVSTELLRATLAALASGHCCGGGTMVQFDRDPGWFGHFSLAVWRVFSRWLHWACGAYIFCLREAFEQVNGFDEQVYASEELYLSRALNQWCRGKRMKFQILAEPIITSGRKLQWFSTAQMLKMVGRFILHPNSVRSRESCHFWYCRPAETEDDGQPSLK